LSCPNRYVCTLCNVEFPSDGESPPRCPHCLRRTGVVPAAHDAPPRRRWRPGRRTFLVLSAAVAAAGLTAAAWFLLPLLSSGDRAGPLEETLIAADMPVPWGDTDSLASDAGEMAGMTPQDAARALSAACHERDGLRLLGPDEHPEAFRTGSEVHALHNGAISRVEAAACLVAMAMASGVRGTPCAPPPPTALVPAWDRAVGLCLGQGTDRTVVVPGAVEADPDAWQSLSMAQFAAVYLAGAAEAADSQPRAYALFRQARALWDDPTILFRLGAAKARMGVKEFAIEDMRQALAAGAGSDGNLLLADTLLEVGEAAEAVQTYDKAGAEAPRVRLGKARALLVLGQTDEAGTQLEPLARDHPDMDGVLETVASWKLRTGDLDGAVQTIENAIRLRPRPDHYLMLDDLLAQQKRPADSLPRLAAGYDATRALRVGERLLRRQIENGQADEAVRFSAQLLEDHADDRSARWLRFEALLAADRTKDADREADAVLRSPAGSDSRSAMIAAAVARLRLEAAGDKGIGLASDMLHKLALDGPRSIYYVTRWLDERGSPDLAERAVVLALEARPADEELTNHLYLLYGLHGRAEEARKVREQALAGLEGETRDAREDLLDRIDRYIQSTRDK